MAFASAFATLTTPSHAQAPALSADFARLNDAQRTAVTLPMTKHAVVLAGAGTGKTSTLVERAAWLVEQGVPPKDILLATFTRAAADEMQTRLKNRLGSRCPKTIGTLHSIALSLSGGFQGLGVQLIEDDALAKLAESLAQDDPAAEGLTPKELILQIGRLREERVLHHPLYGLAERLKAEVDSLGLIDFTGLLELATTRELPTFRHLLVDEAQDLTAAQLALVAKLSGPKTVRYYVGDDDQSIYQFRGAFAGALGGLMHEGATKVCLTENYRCGARILDAANNLIHYNTGRFEKTLVASSGRVGDVVYHDAETTEDEQRFVAQWLVEAQAAGKQLTVLSRTRALLEPYSNTPGIRVASLHESKGLEWEWVILLGLEENQLPHRMSLDIHEERRLAYVGVTRAKERLAIVYTAQRRQRQKRSRFWKETQVFPEAPARLVEEIPLW